MREQKFTLTASPGSTGRADKYLHELFGEEEEIPLLSRSQIQKMLENGLILVDGRPIRAKDPVPAGARIDLTVPAPVEISVEPEDIPVDILYEDPHLIVVNKAPGLTVHPSETRKSGTLVNALLFHVKDLSGIGGKLRPGIVHRIDKDTSGALVVSKTDEAHAGLSKLFSSHTIERRYWALCYGAPAWTGTETFRSSIGRSPVDRKKMAADVPNGRDAVSHFTVLEKYGISGKNPHASMIEARLETGRTHQVRVHLTKLGHSLLGDPVYGTPASNQPKWKALPREVQAAVERLPGQALHARVLGFKHPVNGLEMRFEAPPFEAFRTLLGTLTKALEK